MLTECDGKLGQLWVFDNYQNQGKGQNCSHEMCDQGQGQIRYGGDENFCLDILDALDTPEKMNSGRRLQLRECSNSKDSIPYQSWSWESWGSGWTIFSIIGQDPLEDRGFDGSLCLDFSEDQPHDGQWLHGMECSGQDNQKWSLWDTESKSDPAPLGVVV